jgi:hypothetical protein
MRYKLLIFIGLGLCACNAPQTPPSPARISSGNDAAYIHAAEKKLTDLIITDIFSPPVASRVYVYPLLAAYEAGRFSEKNSTSITAQLKGFEPMPVPEQGESYDYTVAAIKALCTVAPKVLFSTDSLAAFENAVLTDLKGRLTDSVFNRSVRLGQQVGAIINKRLANDNYKETRGMPRYEVKNGIPGRWVPTPPDYADGVEPHWAKMRTLRLDTAAQFRPSPPPFHRSPLRQYSEQKNSLFWQEVVEVHSISKNFTPEQEEILTFWDDNPFVSRHKGHLMFQDKKMTPGGHWLAIAQLILKERQADFYTSLKTYALTSLALYEAFISCWEAKYHYNLVRPETVISAKLDKQWHPVLVTPPFPAYTSGHSTISAAAAEVLTGLFGDAVAFTDTTEKEYGLPVRSFSSFRQAAKEASESRIYAGIHYRSDCEKGNQQGTKLGQWLIRVVN